MFLQSIRERLTGFMAFGILGILIIPFAFVGVSSYSTSSADNLVARVNEKDITTAQFTESFGNYRRRMQSIMGAAFDPVEFESLVSKRRHLETLIDEEVLNQAAEEMNLDMDDESLAQQIRDMPAFRLDGVFSRDLYLARLTSQGLSVQQFERQIKVQAIISQLPTGILTSSITTNTELMEYVSLQDQQRNFSSILVAPKIDEIEADFNAETVQAYYDENQSLFQSEEMVTIEYVELNVLDIDLGTEPDEAFLKNRFEEQKGRFISPEQRLVSHILFEVAANEDEAVITTVQQQAQDLADRARQGEEFAALAGEYSDDLGSADSGGDLGWMGPGVMSNSFEESMYNLTLESPISDPVQTGFGWHVIYLREIQASSGMNFEQARETLIREHQEEEAEREFIDRADLLVDMIYEDPTTLDSAALDLGLEVRQIGPFGRLGGDDIAANLEVVSAAFSELVLLQGSVSDPIDLAENHLVMIRVQEHFPVVVRPIDVVRSQIIEEIRDSRAMDKARSEAEAMLVALQSSDHDLDSVAEQFGYEVILTEAALRRNFIPDRTVVEQVFRLDSPADGETVSAVVAAQNGYALVVLKSVTNGSLDVGSALNEQQYRRLIANAAASIEVTGLIRQLRDTGNVEVYEDRLK